MQNKVYSYLRVSSEEQSLARQYEGLNEYMKESGVQVDERDIIVDQKSGSDFDRPGYKLLVEKLLRENDILVIKELDRLGRNYHLIKDEWQRLISMGVNIVVIDTPVLNTTNKTDLEKNLISNLVFEIMAYFGEKERVSIKKRQREGIDLSLKNGIKFGRPKLQVPSNFAEVHQKWRNGEITAKKAMMVTNLSRSSFYRLAAKYKY
jgi:DNA invertase Pin-like site-specific DNA recombinase